MSPIMMDIWVTDSGIIPTLIARIGAGKRRMTMEYMAYSGFTSNGNIAAKANIINRTVIEDRRTVLARRTSKTTRVHHQRKAGALSM
jgi:hypothetical protein